MTMTLRRADRIPPVGHAKAMRLTEAENARLLTQLRGLTAKQWQAPSDCAGWTVRDVAVHLIASAQAQASLLEFGRQLVVGRLLTAETSMYATVTPADGLRALVRRFTDEVLNAHDAGAALDALVAEDFIEQNPLPGQGPGRAGLAGVLTDMFTAFPDLRWTLRDTIAEDDRIMTLGTWTGTHRAPFMGIPATGRTVTVESWTLDRYRDGRLAESRIIMDVAGMLMQLGLIPAPAA